MIPLHDGDDRRDPAAPAVSPFLTFAMCAYIAALMLATSIPGLSRLVHLSVVLMLAGVAMRSWRIGLSVRRDGLPLAFAAFALLALASVTWAPEQSDAVVSAGGLGVGVIGSALLLLGLANGASLRALGLAALASAAVLAATGAAQLGEEELRVTGLANNANSLAIRISLGTLLGLLALPRSVAVRLVATALLALATVTSGSRKMIFVWFAYCMHLARLVGFRLRSSSLLAALALLLFPFALLAAFENREALLAPFEELVVVERIQATLEGEESSADLRAGMAREALAVWSISPYIGHGIDQFRHVSSRYGTYSHNNYTEILASFGLLGLLLWYGALLALVVRFLRRAARGDDVWLPVLVLLMMLLWDVALVSYSNRMVWATLAVLLHLSKAPLPDARPEAEPDAPVAAPAAAPVTAGAFGPLVRPARPAARGGASARRARGR